MRGEILGVERRRRWSDEEKLAVVTSVGMDGATVTQVAQRHEITRQQVYAWRHEMKRKGLWHPEGGLVFLPVEGAPQPETPPPPERESTIVVVELANGRCLRVASGIAATDLARLIRVVERA